MLPSEVRVSTPDVQPSASDPFAIYPSEADVSRLERGFVAVKDIYLSAFRPRGSYTSFVSAETLATLSEFGSAGKMIYDFYVEQADIDKSRGLDETREPWRYIGLPIPGSALDFASDPETAVDTFSVGDLGPVPFDSDHDVPDVVKSLVIRRSVNETGFEGVFVGYAVSLSAN